MTAVIHPLRSTSYVTLGVAAEVFAIPVACVREILDDRALTRLANAPPTLIGMIDVRGVTIPVLDLSLRLGLPAVQSTPQTRIMVLEVGPAGQPLVIGLRVDRVYEVVEWEDRTVEPPPDIGMRWQSEYIQGICRHRGQLVVIFETSHLFSSDDLMHLEGPT